MFARCPLRRLGKVIALVAILMLSFIWLGTIFHASNFTIANGNQPRRLGFWVGESDMWGGGGLNWSSQQFVSSYFETAPYPSALIFATSGGYLYPQEINWLSQVLSVTDTMNVKVILLCFINLSGGTINGRPDQTSSFTAFINSLKGHPSLYGAEYENEYYGDTTQEEQTFSGIVTGAGYIDVINPKNTSMMLFPSYPVLGYSEYPYFTGTLIASASSRYIGIGYGETGSPPVSGPNPLWTQTVIQNIVDNSYANPNVFIYSEIGGTGQPWNFLWNWPTLRNWVWSDPNYQANYVLSSSLTSSSSSSVLTTTSTISSSSSTTVSNSTTTTTRISTSTFNSTTSIFGTTISTSDSSISQSTFSTSSAVSTSTTHSATTTTTTLRTTAVQTSSSIQSVSQSSAQASTQAIGTVSQISSTHSKSSTPASQNALVAFQPPSSPISPSKTAIMYSFAGYVTALIGGLPLIFGAIIKNQKVIKITRSWRW